MNGQRSDNSGKIVMSILLLTNINRFWLPMYATATDLLHPRHEARLESL